MKVLIKPQSKLEMTSFNNTTYQVEANLINAKIKSDNKFYQKLLILFLTLCAFLIFPESPQDSDLLCKEYNSKEACMVW